MFKWLKYWQVSRQRRENFARIAQEMQNEGAYPPPTQEEVKAFIDEMSFLIKHDITTSHCMSPIPKQQIINVVSDQIQPH